MTPGARCVAAVLGAAVVTAPTAARAAPAEVPTERLQVVSVAEQEVELLLSGTGQSLATLDVASVQVRLAGRPADTVVTRAVAAGDDRAVMLLMDVSGSMRGERMEAARAAALAFLTAAPADVRVGLTTFGSQVAILAEPTADREPVRQAVMAAVADGDTKLYDALVAGALLLDSNDSLLLLSDGADDGSTASGQQAAQAVVESGASLTALDLQNDASVTAALQELATTTAGRVVRAASADTVATALRTEADALDHQVVLTVRVPAGLGAVTVAAHVTATAGGQRVEAETPVQLVAPAAGVPGPRWQPLSSDSAPATDAPSVRWGLAALFLGLVLLGAMLIGSVRGSGHDRRRTVQLLERYTVRPADAEGLRSLQEESVVARGALGAAARLLRRPGREERLLAMLQAAGCALQPTEWVLLRVGAAVVGGGALWVLGGLFGAVVGILVGAGVPQVWLGQRASARRREFADSLPDALALVVGGLSSGYSFAQALDTVVREGREPMAGEIGRALAEARLGVPLEEALEAVADRMESEDLRWVVMAVGVQREVGGSLAHVLQTVFETMRERARIRRQVRTLSAEGRVSAALLVSLPIFMAVYQMVFRRDYMRPMFTEPLGLMMLAGTGIALLLGALWTRALVKVDV